MIHNILRISLGLASVLLSTMLWAQCEADHNVIVTNFEFTPSSLTVHQGDRHVILRVETNAGHGAGKPIGKILDEQADKWAFMLNELDALTP